MNRNETEKSELEKKKMHTSPRDGFKCFEYSYQSSLLIRREREENITEM